MKKFDPWPFWRRWLGQRSERAAACYLRSKRYRILAANVADRSGEFDLLALDGRVIVFVEVRSTSGSDPQVALATVDRAKQKRLVDSAVRFLGRHRLHGIASRFDVLGLAWPADKKVPTIIHVVDAFSPTDRFQFHS